MTQLGRRRLPVQLMVLVLVVFGLPSVGVVAAWACIPQANLVTLAPRSSGPAGAMVTVEGLGLDPGPAEIRWNAADGPLLGKGEGPSLSVPVTIPEAEEGLYIVVVVSRQPGGGIGNTARAAFQVTGADGTDTASPPFSDPAEPEANAPSVARTVLTMAAGAGLLGVGIVIGSIYGRRTRTRRTSTA